MNEASTQLQYDILSDIYVGMQGIEECITSVSRVSNAIYDSVIIGKGIMVCEDKILASMNEFSSVVRERRIGLDERIGDLSKSVNRIEDGVKE